MPDASPTEGTFLRHYHTTLRLTVRVDADPLGTAETGERLPAEVLWDWVPGADGARPEHVALGRVLVRATDLGELDLTPMFRDSGVGYLLRRELAAAHDQP